MTEPSLTITHLLDDMDFLRGKSLSIEYQAEPDVMVVEVNTEGGVSVTFTLDPDEVRKLATALLDAVDELE